MVKKQALKQNDVMTFLQTASNGQGAEKSVTAYFRALPPPHLVQTVELIIPGTHQYEMDLESILVE